MKILKSYKYRIYPNKEQETLIQKTFGCCRFVYNQVLAHKIELYQTQEQSLSRFDCEKYMIHTKGFLSFKSKPVYIPFRRACGPVQVGQGESGLLPDRTQGAGVSRRLAGEVYGLA